jgi:hypothetical protein
VADEGDLGQQRIRCSFGVLPVGCSPPLLESFQRLVVGGSGLQPGAAGLDLHILGGQPVGGLRALALDPLDIGLAGAQVGAAGGACRARRSSLRSAQPVGCLIELGAAALALGQLAGKRFLGLLFGLLAERANRLESESKAAFHFLSFDGVR